MAKKKPAQTDLHLGSMTKYFCWQAHALYILAVDRCDIAADSIARPQAYSWGTAYQNYIDAPLERITRSLKDIAAVHPQIASWLSDLP